MQEGFFRTQEVYQELALQNVPKGKEWKNSTPLLITPPTLPSKNIILKNFKLLQNDSKTATTVEPLLSRLFGALINSSDNPEYS